MFLKPEGKRRRGRPCTRWPDNIEKCLKSIDANRWKTKALYRSRWLNHMFSTFFGGRGTRVVQVSDRGLPCHEFEPNTTEDPPCRAVMHVKSVES
ncbi:hypothetical protein TNCV_2677651 [Trichonephila clavipes]|nr:hypothetical protein TNCV_2677651 [Trichonephila clavipes]